MLPQITLIACISRGKFKAPIITNTTPLNMLENNIDISKAPLIRLIFFIPMHHPAIHTTTIRKNKQAFKMRHSLINQIH